MRNVSRRAALAGAAAALAAPAIVRAQNAPLEIQFFFPIAVSGPITKIIDGYAADFEAEHKGIRIKPVYAGNYDDTIAKAITAFKAGKAPPIAMVGAIQVFTLIDLDAIVPIDELANTPEDKAWLDGFFPAFMANGSVDGHIWSVPFQRSTAVLYWNKDAFKQAGLDPETPPATWTEQTDMGRKLVVRDGGSVSRWGVQIPATGGTYWLYQALAQEAGQQLMNKAGTETYFDKPGSVEALEYWVALGKQGVQAPGVLDWGATPNDFVAGRTAMMWTTTGNLTFVRNNAKFPFGVAMLPADKQRGTPTGGGSFYVFSTATKEEREASLLFIKWATTPERAAQWGMDTGYVATRPDAWATERMKQYVAGFPQAAVARDQLQYAVPELSTHQNQAVTLPLNAALQAALAGTKQPRAALAEAQANADRLLRPFRKA
ncbi:MAG TPA: ABC transporter substrate-binding protein [Acetobacteraceae bacterium]|nr:ABC transporter substrate-binding protein [Acetobacteraceae bacterium]